MGDAQLEVIRELSQIFDAESKFTKNLISDSPTLPPQLMDGTLDQQYIIIDVTPAITLILEGKLHQIQ